VENLAVFCAIAATLVTVSTIVAYENFVKRLRAEIAYKDEHIHQCQHLISSMVRHPAGQVSPNLRIVQHGNDIA
jgi:hypothetical protein